MLRLHESTKQFTENYSKTLPHALLLVGPAGVGLGTLAKHLAEQSGRLLTTVTPEAKTSTSVPTISVEPIRELYTQTRAKLDGPHFVIIDDADAMNHVAQNALLKLLEEPNESIHFILTSHTADKLLPTIRSRTQVYNVPGINELESKRLLTSLGIKDEMDIRRLLYIAPGLPAELARLASDGKSFRELSELVAKARGFVEGNTYQKIIIIQSLKDDRAGALKLIDMILLLLRRTLATSANTKTVRLIETLVSASEAIRGNANIRLQLIRAVL